MSSAEPKIEVFWVSGSPFSWRVLLALEAKRLPYQSNLLQASKGDNKTPGYLALNPRGRVPTLRHGDVVIYESLAILAYLDRTFPDVPLFGRTAQETGRIWQAISEFTSYTSPPMTNVARPLLFGKQGEEEAAIRSAAAVVHDEFAQMEKTFDGKTWLAGDAMTAADLAAYPMFQLLLRAAAKDEAKPLDLGLAPLDERYPRLAAWMGGVEKLPGYARTRPPHWN
ncbi:MAG: glutathione S-transferase family protein [Rhodospirillales bacterium]|nr:glutathione S-transferase family protein [Rhodospirillales bacterium]